jgi:hypothetical protein
MGTAFSGNKKEKAGISADLYNEAPQIERIPNRFLEALKLLCFKKLIFGLGRAMPDCRLMSNFAKNGHFR